MQRRPDLTSALQYIYIYIYIFLTQTLGKNKKNSNAQKKSENESCWGTGGGFKTGKSESGRKEKFHCKAIGKGKKIYIYIESPPLSPSTRGSDLG